MADRPGVMLYFDVRPALRFLDTEQKGLLFQSILDYAELGVVPELDGICGVAWEFIRPKLDKDSAAYNEKVAKAKYAVYSREEKKHNRIPLEYDEWKMNQAISDDSIRYPTTTPTAATTPTATSAPKSNSNSSSAETAAGTGGAGEEPAPFDFEGWRKKRIDQLRAKPP